MADKTVNIKFNADASGAVKGSKEAGAAIKGAAAVMKTTMKPALDAVAASTENYTGKVKTLRTQIRENMNAAAQLAAKHGFANAGTQEAITKTAKLKDAQEELNERIAASHPEAKFRVLGQAVQGAANAFAGIQGAMALFGAESEDAQKMMLKVQASMALAQGIQSINQLKEAFIALNLVIAANPILAVSIGIAAAAGAIAYALGAFSSFKTELTTLEKVQSNIIAVNKKAQESAYAEMAVLKTAISVAKNEANSKDLRLQALKKINEISPEYVKNLNLENINTSEGERLTNSATEAVMRNAKAKAYASEIEKQYTILIAEQKKLDESAAVAKTLNVKPVIDPETGKPFAINDYASQQRKISEDKIAVAKGEIKYFQDEITKFSLNGPLEVFKTKDDKPKTKDKPKVPYDSGPIDRLAPLLKQKTLKSVGILEDFQNTIEPLTTIEFKIPAAPAANVVNKVKLLSDEIAQAMLSMAQATRGAIEGVFSGVGEALGVGIADSLSGTEDAFKSLDDTIINALLGLAKQIGTILITMGTGMLISGLATAQGIAAIAGGTMLIGLASGIGQIRSNNAADSIGNNNTGGSVGSIKMAGGGIVPGNFYSGDRVSAMLNSSEMVLNSGQQSKLWNMISSGGGGGAIIPDVKIAGQDLLIVFNRASKVQGRTT